MKKVTKTIILAALIIAGLASCSDRITYVDPFAGKTFYMNKGKDYEIYLSFTDTGNAVLSANVLVLKTDTDSSPSNMKLVFERMTLYEFNYNFTGRNSTLVLTPKKTIAYYTTTTTIGGESEIAVTKAELLDTERYCKVLEAELKVQLENIKSTSQDEFYDFFKKMGYSKEQADSMFDTIVHEVSEKETNNYVFHSQKYNYQFNKRDVSTGLKYVLFLSKTDLESSPGAESYSFSEVVVR